MRALLALVVLLCAAPAAAQEGWTVAQRMRLPDGGQVLDLAPLAAAHEDFVRIRLVGSYSFGVDGSEIDAMARTVGGTRDVTAGPFVVLPPGSRVIAEDPAAHRYTIEIPRSRTMPIHFNVLGLATRYLMTPTEVMSNMVGAIEVEHLVPPPPPPTATQQVARTASAVPVMAWVGGGSGALLLLGLGFVLARRRRDPIRELLRRARRANTAIAREVVALGPAYDPVAASAERLHEAAGQHAEHHRAIGRALARTASMASKRRGELAVKRDDARVELETVVDRLEDTATQLAGRTADSDKVRHVEALVSALDIDLSAAVEAEEELGL